MAEVDSKLLSDREWQAQICYHIFCLFPDMLLAFYGGLSLADVHSCSENQIHFDLQ